MTASAAPAAAADAGVRADKAEKLYQRVFNDYGDDSVAQLGGVHLAVEDASNILTKVLERGRLMAYLEQSTRYIPYTERRGEQWRYLVPAELDGHPLRAEYVAAMNATFEIYARWIPVMQAWFEARYPKAAGRFGRRAIARPSARRRSTRCAGCCRRRRSRTSACTAPARRSKRCCCACARIRWSRRARRPT